MHCGACTVGHALWGMRYGACAVWHALCGMRYLELSPLQAITCATKEGARALRLNGRVGTVETGMLADVIVVDKDPLQDVTVRGRTNLWPT